MRRCRRAGLRLLAGPLVVTALSACGREDHEPRNPVLTLGATHTLEDSGLLQALISSFPPSGGTRVRAVVGTTGEVLTLARRGDVDVVLTHDAAGEARLVEEGMGRARIPVMYNDFVVVGPRADPAGVAGAGDAAEAFRRIAAAEALFLSRGDDSGTHRKERRLWSRVLTGDTLTGPDPTPGRDRPAANAAWYLEAGLGMADALRVASERAAYTLTDRATFAVLRRQLELTPVLEGDPILRNVYAAVVVAGGPREGDALALVEWLRGPAARDLMSGLGGDAGPALFRPWPQDAAAERPPRPR